MRKNVELAEKLARGGYIKSARSIVRNRVARGSVIVIEVNRTEPKSFCRRCATYTKSLLDTTYCHECGEDKR